MEDDWLNGIIAQAKTLIYDAGRSLTPFNPGKSTVTKSPKIAVYPSSDRRGLCKGAKRVALITANNLFVVEVSKLSKSKSLAMRQGGDRLF